MWYVFVPVCVSGSVCVSMWITSGCVDHSVLLSIPLLEGGWLWEQILSAAGQWPIPDGRQVGLGLWSCPAPLLVSHVPPATLLSVPFSQ